ncbi:uncharacterized protein LOC128127322 [Lactuca sativa]|uniref:uncharacterized protein LOC128127322 n=1 Tax=Lactuca sativa TaxID=4236 RepID=UPI0022AFAD6C|nr:uncharacterized protein LOC128127322 [Lactuca sativa]
MAGLRLPGDPYFPNQGNVGWIEKEPGEPIEEDPEKDPEEEPEEEEDEVDEEDEEEGEEVDMDEDESEEEPKVFNLPYIARVPANHFGYNRPEPRWATLIERWSRQQRQRSPYGDQSGYYNLSHRGPADRALRVMVQHITNLGNQSREMADQVRNLSVVMAATDARTGIWRGTSIQWTNLSRTIPLLERRTMPPRKRPRPSSSTTTPPPLPPPQFDPAMFQVAPHKINTRELFASATSATSTTPVLVGKCTAVIATGRGTLLDSVKYQPNPPLKLPRTPTPEQAKPVMAMERQGTSKETAQKHKTPMPEVQEES